MFEQKQKEMEESRTLITNICSGIYLYVKQNLENTKQILYLSKKHQTAYCPVAKVATSSMNFFFLRTGMFILSSRNSIYVYHFLRGKQQS